MKSIILSTLLLYSSLLSAASLSDHQIVTVASGLQFPYSIAFLPNGDHLVTEKTGRLRVIRDGRLLAAAVLNVPEVYVGYQGGLLDIAVHPRFEQNHWLYLSLTQGEGDLSSLRVFRGEYRTDTRQPPQLINVVELFRAPPLHPIAPGGRLLFLPDETLLLSVGDGFEHREQAQNTANTLGSIVRLHDDGRIPGDNPFVNTKGASPAVYSYGHRVVIGLWRDNTSGAIYAHENGPLGGDELNRIQAGKNYGWPIASYGITYSGAKVSPFTHYPKTEQPLAQWTPSIAPSGLTQCQQCRWPDWEGDLLVGFLAGKQVRRIRLTEGVVNQQEILFKELGERIRDVRFGPEGELFLLTDNVDGKVMKVTPSTKHSR